MSYQLEIFNPENKEQVLFLSLVSEASAVIDNFIAKAQSAYCVFWVKIDSAQEERPNECEQLLEALAQKGLKRATLVALASAFSWAGSLALKDSKYIRRLLLLAPKIRKTPDFRPVLHRLRLPVLLLGDQAMLPGLKEIQSRIPSAWLREVDLNSSDAMLSSLQEFSQVPTKRPQKNL